VFPLKPLLARISLIVPFLCALPLPAHAETVEACVASNADGQVLQSQGQLLAAVEKFQLCAAEACPEEIRRDCGTAMLAAKAIVPSVVIAVRRGDEDILDALVLIDKSRQPVRLDGRPIELDPGPHVVRVHHGSHDAIERQMVLRQGERNRLISIELPSRVVKASPERPRSGPEPVAQAQAPGPSDKSEPIPKAAWVAGGVGVLSLGSFVVFGLDGKSKEAALDRCKPSCDPGAVGSMRRRYLIADVSLGLSVLSLGTAVWLWWPSAGPVKASGNLTASIGIDSSGSIGVTALGRF